MAHAKHVVEQHVEAFNGRQPTADPWSEGAEFVAPGASMRGRDEILGFLNAFQEAFPDARLELSRLLAEGSVAAGEGRFIGTHTGVFHTPNGDGHELVAAHGGARAKPALTSPRHA